MVECREVAYLRSSTEVGTAIYSIHVCTDGTVLLKLHSVENVDVYRLVRCVRLKKKDRSRMRTCADKFDDVLARIVLSCLGSPPVDTFDMYVLCPDAEVLVRCIKEAVLTARSPYARTRRVEECLSRLTSR